MTDGNSVTWSALSAFQRDLLVAISHVVDDGGEPYGLALKRDLEREYDEEINHGRLYMNLDNLVEYDLVEKSQLDRRTNAYRLTTTAEQLLRERASRLADLVGAYTTNLAADGGESA